VLVREAGGDVRREAPGARPLERGRAAERFFGLGRATELVQHQAPVDVRLHVAGIELHRGVERLERLGRLVQERTTEPHQVVRVREGAPGREHVLEEVHRPVVVLQREALARFPDVPLR
jgi:hypothetical protein